jgi:glycosyltransferase involved in cell wall biosynthesis
MHNPLISIITVVYNGAHTLEQTILSVINQTYKNIEYIIIDGGSTDGTIDIIKKNENKLAYWISEPDKGIYDAMNKGIKQATGVLIGIINSDDWYELDAVENIVNKFNEQRNIAIYYGNIKIIYENKEIYQKNKKIKHITAGMAINHPTCFVHREIYETVGLFDINYRIVADYDFILRSFLLNIPFFNVEQILVNMSAGGISDINYIEGWQEEKKSLRKNGFSRLYANYFYLEKRIKRFILNICRVFGKY